MNDQYQALIFVCGVTAAMFAVVSYFSPRRRKDMAVTNQDAVMLFGATQTSTPAQIPDIYAPYYEDGSSVPVLAQAVSGVITNNQSLAQQAAAVGMAATVTTTNSGIGMQPGGGTPLSQWPPSFQVGPSALDPARLMLVEMAVKRLGTCYEEKLSVMQQNIDELAQDNATLRAGLAAQQAFMAGYKKGLEEQVRFLTNCIQGTNEELKAARSHVAELTTLTEKLMQDLSSLRDQTGWTEADTPELDDLPAISTDGGPMSDYLPPQSSLLRPLWTECEQPFHVIGQDALTIVSDMYGHSFTVTQHGEMVSFSHTPDTPRQLGPIPLAPREFWQALNSPPKSPKPKRKKK